jgi:iron complex outermembrane receptor protein
MKSQQRFNFPRTRSPLSNCLFLCLLIFILSALLWPAQAGASQSGPLKLTDISLEELMKMEVTSVSKHPQMLADAAAAIYVITQEDIRRSGANNLPDVLRMVPGLHVARISSHIWAISIRGFNDRFANKLLVLVDGRAVYTEMFSGVFYSRNDMMLEDIERIEIIRGPGATLWGANAVNGVINITTKKARDTQGFLVSAGAGTEEDGFVSARYGGTLEDKGAFRIYAKAKDWAETVNAQGDDTHDDWQSMLGGFRLDLTPGPKTEFTVQGDVYKQNKDSQLGYTTLAPPYYSQSIEQIETSGANLLARWNKGCEADSHWQAQAYYDYHTSEDSADLNWNTHILDFDLHNNRSLGGVQRLTWGLAYCLSYSEVETGSNLTFDPEIKTNNRFSAFVQDEIDLVKEELRLCLGSKFEHNEDTGFEVQPSARLLWKMDVNHSLWAAVSRAIRTPSRGELDSVLRQIQPQDPLPPVMFEIHGNKDLEAEELIAYEAGYRTTFCESVSLDVAAYYNRYNNLVSILQPTGPMILLPDPVPHFVAYSRDGNDLKAASYGVELNVKFDINKSIRLIGAYSYGFIEIIHDEDQNYIFGGVTGGKSPRHMVGLRAQIDFPKNVELDIWLRYVDELPELNIPSYLTADLRLAWHPSPDWEIALVGQNLLDSQHPEFLQTDYLASNAAEIERSVYAKITWHF